MTLLSLECKKLVEQMRKRSVKLFIFVNLKRSGDFYFRMGRGRSIANNHRQIDNMIVFGSFTRFQRLFHVMGCIDRWDDLWRLRKSMCAVRCISNTRTASSTKPTLPPVSKSIVATAHTFPISLRDRIFSHR